MASRILWIALSAGALSLSGCGDAEQTAPTEANAQEGQVAPPEVNDEKSPPDENTDTRPPKERISLTMDGAQDIFSNNALRAQEKFSGKVIVLTGLFDAASASYDGKPELNFRRLMGGSSYAVSAEIVEQARSDALDLNSGDLVEIVCQEFDPKFSLTYVKFRGCSDIRLLKKAGRSADGMYQSMILDEGDVR